MDAQQKMATEVYDAIAPICKGQPFVVLEEVLDYLRALLKRECILKDPGPWEAGQDKTQRPE